MGLTHHSLFGEALRKCRIRLAASNDHSRRYGRKRTKVRKKAPDAVTVDLDRGDIAQGHQIGSLRNLIDVDVSSKV